MSCADCNPGANVAIVGGDNVVVDGIGTAADPYMISVTSVPDGDYALVSNETVDPDLNLSTYALPTTVLAHKVSALGGTAMLPDWPTGTSGSITILFTSDVAGTISFQSVLTTGGTGTGFDFITTSGGKDLIRVLWTGAEWVITDVLQNLA